MKLYELYEEVVTSEAWKKLDEILCDESLIQEVDSVDLNTDNGPNYQSMNAFPNSSLTNYL